MKLALLILCSLTLGLALSAQQVDEAGIPTDSPYSMQEDTPLMRSSKSNTVNVLHTIPSPTSSTLDIAFDGENLWQASNSGTTYQISPLDGTVLKTISVNTSYSSGITFDGQHLWISDKANELILHVDTAEGIVLQEFEVNNDGANGLAFDNVNLWLNNNQEGSSIGDTTYHISSADGSIIDSYVSIGPQPTGLAFDGTYLWISDNFYDEIYKVDPSTFTVVETLDAPGGTYPNGLAFDGQYLWVANNSTDSIYQIDIGIVPSSLEENTADKDLFQVFPNPSEGHFFIQGNQPEADATLAVHDTQGRKLFEERLTNSAMNSVDLQEYESGVYSYTIVMNKRVVQTGFLLKQ